MHLRNKPDPWAIFIVLLCVVAFSAAQTQQNRPDQKPDQKNDQKDGQKNDPKRAQTSAQSPDIDPSDPAVPVWMRPAVTAASGKGAGTPAGEGGANVPQGQKTPPPGEVTSEKGGFRFRKDVEEVTLPVTVVDQKQHLVTSLNRANFVIYEDNAPQEITSFRREDIPVSIGIVVDNSGSMRQKRAAVTKAVVNLVQASNPQDEAFIVNFNDEPYLDQDFTSDIGLMREALDRVDSRGGTALYDAVIAAADHLAKLSKHEKKVLLVVTDGEDNESREPLEQSIRTVQNESGPTIYTIGILGSEGRQRSARRALEALSVQTGGVAFFPKNLAEVDEISQAVAHDIRNQYSITYKPSNPQNNGGYRKVKVVAHAPGYKDLQVRTRSGYFAGQQRAAK
ncbi:MAG TPA: VWA domain-containing protein [Candidatus Angelobacter sp.]|nr:VWA domain-containing protein [Candidatus Angelobacter sp.]